jgi:hypothetical protein
VRPPSELISERHFPAWASDRAIMLARIILCGVAPTAARSVQLIDQVAAFLKT